METARKVSGEGTILWECAELSLQQQLRCQRSAGGCTRLWIGIQSLCPGATGCRPAQTGRCCCSDRGLAVGVGLGWVHVKDLWPGVKDMGLVRDGEGTVTAFPLKQERNWGL